MFSLKEDEDKDLVLKDIKELSSVIEKFQDSSTKLLQHTCWSNNYRENIVSLKKELLDIKERLIAFEMI